jgi:hypothetical protein
MSIYNARSYHKVKKKEGIIFIEPFYHDQVYLIDEI